MEPRSTQALALAKFFADWRLPGANTLLSLATILSFLFSQWRNIPALSSIWQPLTRRVTASVTLQSEDRLTKEVIDWVAANILWPRKARFWIAHSDKSEMERERESRRMYGPNRRFRSVEQNDSIQFAPENQSTWFIFRKRIFIVHQKANYSPPSPYAYGRDEEAVQIICIGRTMTPIKLFLETCRSFAKRHVESFVSIYTSTDARWHEQNLQPARPLETIHLDPEVKQSLIADVCDYVAPKTRRFYADRGIPYRRGYLLHGPPGTGKTSLCIAIAGIIKLPLYILRISSLSGDQELETLFNALPSNCLVLMEDIDAIRLERSNKSKSKSKKADLDEQPCTLSGLLNVLDGVASSEGRVVIMTANSPQVLDRALVRPGRIDRKFFLGHMSPNSARSMFLRIVGLVDTFPEGKDTSEKTKGVLAQPNTGPDEEELDALKTRDELERLADEFSAAIPEATFTPAQIQEYLLKQRGNAHDAVANAPKWVTEEKARMEEEAREELEEKKRQEEEDDD
ncbi:Mitochondrial chaperone BCS1 [Paramyrothecium foliicola]|nr:Mitochondrial chaperone BCS1 [Paramyrothecium foliicola]